MTSSSSRSISHKIVPSCIVIASVFNSLQDLVGSQYFSTKRYYLSFLQSSGFYSDVWWTLGLEFEVDNFFIIDRNEIDAATGWVFVLNVLFFWIPDCLVVNINLSSARYELTNISLGKILFWNFCTERLKGLQS